MDRIGVDIGGTFTDWITVDTDGNIKITKVESTVDPVDGVFNALEQSGVTAPEILSFDHGTTLGTNALIQRKHPRVAMLTTKGFRGIMTEVAKGAKEDIWDMYDPSPRPSMVPYRDRFDVEERTRANGDIEIPLNEEQARDVVRIVKRRGINVIAICFLHGYANTKNEKRMKEIVLEDHPDAIVVTSHETVPRIYEYERFTTTLLNVALMPIMGDYLDALEGGMHEKGYKSDVLIAQSAGGLMSVGIAKAIPIRTANSGPAAGAVAGAKIGEMAGYNNVIGLDMGGTSTDVSVAVDGVVRTVQSWHIEWGHPIMFPAIDVITIGAGGGSIAWFDEGGKLRSGPQSVGSNPGPACYMRGGEEPTNTDANMVMGTLQPDTFLGGAMKVDKSLSEKVITEKIANTLGMDAVEASDAILRIAEANMADAISLATVRKGLDPRDFVLIPFGGAGPLHGARLAKELSIPKVIVPPNPGLTSALGCVLADIVHSIGASVFYPDSTQADLGALEAQFQDFERQLAERLDVENVPADRRRTERALDMCYAGQWRVLAIPVDGEVNAENIEKCVKLYHETHLREHGLTLDDRPIEIHGVTSTGIGITDKPDFKPVTSKGKASDALIGNPRSIYWREAERWLDTPIYARGKMLPGAVVEGPAIVEQVDSTIVLPPDTSTSVDQYLNLVIEQV